MHQMTVTNIRNSSYDIIFDKYPDECPICHSNIFGSRLIARFPNEIVSPEVQIIFQCTNYNCEKIFISNYRNSNNNYQSSGLPLYNYISSYPVFPIKHQFSDVINNLSINFVDIYNQAIAAESIELFQLNGLGLRKALEFLVKDFATYKNTSQKDKIIAIPLGKCIEQFIDDINVKECSKRAVWLGNDETHYLKKWEDKDIVDLKLLIRLTVNWIENVLLTEKYIKDMAENKNE